MYGTLDISSATNSIAIKLGFFENYSLYVIKKLLSPFQNAVRFSFPRFI